MNFGIIAMRKSYPFINVVLFRSAPQQIPVEQPIDLFLNRPAYTTFLPVGITARPITPLASPLFNRPQGIVTPTRAAPKSHPRLGTLPPLVTHFI
jgi:hypothetical protein